jgi:MerR family transcriptional regulator, Zn(II)-responsive regulator of zntA
VKTANAPIQPNGKPLLVGHVARLTGVKPDTLRFYEKSGLMPKADRTSGGYRAYGPQALATVQFIRKVKRILRLRQSGSPPCDYVIQLAEERLQQTEQQLRQLQTFRDALRRYVRHCKRTVNPNACAATQFCNLIEQIDVDLPRVSGNQTVRGLKK